MAYCATRRAMLLVDPLAAWGQVKETAAAKASDPSTGVASLGLTGEAARNAAIFFPRVIKSDPQLNGQPDVFAPCGVVAGIIARTDGTRGVWKAPAGLDAALNGVQGLQVNLTDGENGVLNPLGINCLRSFPVSGRVVWGSRTLRGADLLADEYKYMPVRRLALFIEESLYRGTQWVVFEPNDEPLWAQIRLNVGAFMQNLFRQGAFQGSTPRPPTSSSATARPRRRTTSTSASSTSWSASRRSSRPSSSSSACSRWPARSPPEEKTMAQFTVNA